jgi:DNA-binding HxlR family transcriptional regulator
MAVQNKHVSCPVETTLRVLGGRWKALVLREFQVGTRRFQELHRALPRISARTLTRQLRELERDRLVCRRVHAEVPPRVEYALTAHGRSLRSVLGALHRWGERHAARTAVTPGSTAAGA